MSTMIPRLAFTLALPLAFVACSEDASQTSAAPEAQAASEPVKAGPRLSPPDRDLFAERFAEACPDAEAVNEVSCLAQGMGSHDFTCEFGLGEDEVLRYEGVLSEVDGEYVLQDADSVCAQGA